MENGMVIEEHIQTAQDFLEASDREFDAGDVLQGSEKLWGAASHAVIAVAQQRGWPYGKHQSLKVVVRRLHEESGDDLLVAWFGLAEKFHANFCHDFMEDFQLEEDRPLVRRFVERMLEQIA